MFKDNKCDKNMLKSLQIWSLQVFPLLDLVYSKIQTENNVHAESL